MALISGKCNYLKRATFQQHLAMSETTQDMQVIAIKR